MLLEARNTGIQASSGRGYSAVKLVRSIGYILREEQTFIARGKPDHHYLPRSPGSIGYNLVHSIAPLHGLTCLCVRPDSHLISTLSPPDTGTQSN